MDRDKLYGVGTYKAGTYVAEIDNTHTKEYMLWKAMLARCYASTSTKAASYFGCSASDDFNNFQVFAKWCNEQVGFNSENYQLDKDLLIEGNKEYSKEACVFIPKDLNCFSRINEGKFLQGVNWHDQTGKFRARIQDVLTGKRISLGLFNSEKEAHLTYKEAKKVQAQQWYNRLTSGEFVVDERVVNRMKLWQ